MSIVNEIKELVIHGDNKTIQDKVNEALKQKVEPTEIINEGLITGMGIIGERFKTGECYTPEMMLSARAMQTALDILKPVLQESGQDIKGHTIVLGTVKGDLHDIGKNLVKMMWEGAGFDVVDLGVDVPAENFVSAVKEHNAEIVGLSALLTSTMEDMKVAVEALRKEYNDGVKILVGGAPVTQAYADEINADGYAPDAANAVDKVKEIGQN